MSRSKKRKQFAAILGASLLASKLGMLGGASKMKSNVMGAASKARKSGLKMPTSKMPISRGTAMGKIAAKAVKKPTGTVGSQPFSMFGVKSMPSKSNLEKFRAANERQRMRKFGDKTKSKSMSKSSAPGFFGLKFDKPLFSKGKMIKARGGGMAKTKPTKMY